MVVDELRNRGAGYGLDCFASLNFKETNFRANKEGREGVKWELGFAFFRGWEMGFCALGLGFKKKKQ